MPEAVWGSWSLLAWMHEGGGSGGRRWMHGILRASGPASTMSDLQSCCKNAHHTTTVLYHTTSSPQCQSRSLARSNPLVGHQYSHSLAFSSKRLRTFSVLTYGPHLGSSPSSCAEVLRLHSFIPLIFRYFQVCRAWSLAFAFEPALFIRCPYPAVL